MSKLFGRPPERKYLPFQEKAEGLKPAQKIVRPEKPISNNSNNNSNNNNNNNNSNYNNNSTIRNNSVATNNNVTATKKSTSTFNLIPWGTGQAKKIMGSSGYELSKKLKDAKIFQIYDVFTKKWWIDTTHTYIIRSVHKTFSALKRKLTKSMTTFTDFNLDESLWNMKVYVALFPTNKDSIDYINEYKKSWFLKTIQKRLSRAIRSKKRTQEPLSPSEEKDPDILAMLKLTMTDFKDVNKVKQKLPSLAEYLTTETEEFIKRVIEEEKNMPFENAETVLEKGETGEPKKEIKEKRFRLFGSKTSDEIVGTTFEQFTEKINKAKIYRKYNLTTKQWDVDPFLETKVTNRKRQYHNLKRYIKKDLETFENVEGLLPPDWDESVFCVLFPETAFAVQKINEKKIDALRELVFNIRFELKKDVKKETYIRFRGTPDGKEVFGLTFEELKNGDELEKRSGFRFFKGHKDELRNAIQNLQLDEMPEKRPTQAVGGSRRRTRRIRRSKNKTKNNNQRRKPNFIF